MKKCLVILAKTPGMSSIKTRLVKEIGQDKALEFYQLCKACLSIFVKGGKHSTYIATAEKLGARHTFWKGFDTFHAEGDSLGDKQHFIFEKLLAEYHAVVLVGMDIPQMDQELINKAFYNLEKTDYVLGPSQDGGFYLFGSRRKIPKLIWCETPWSTSETAKEFIKLLDQEPVYLRALTDVDHFSDLKTMVKEMPRNKSMDQKKIVGWIRAIT